MTMTLFIYLMTCKITCQVRSTLVASEKNLQKFRKLNSTQPRWKIHDKELM